MWDCQSWSKLIILCVIRSFGHQSCNSVIFVSFTARIRILCMQYISRISQPPRQLWSKIQKNLMRWPHICFTLFNQSGLPLFNGSLQILMTSKLVLTFWPKHKQSSVQLFKRSCWLVIFSSCLLDVVFIWFLWNWKIAIAKKLLQMVLLSWMI